MLDGSLFVQRKAEYFQVSKFSETITEDCILSVFVTIQVVLQ